MLMTTPGVSRALVRRALFALLRRVEQDAVTGRLTLAAADGRVLGHAVLAGGRVCFVAPIEDHERIGEILAGEDLEFQRRLDQAALAARARGLRLCEALLEDGQVELPTLRQGLRRQAAAALLSMASSAGGVVMRQGFVPARDDYDRRLTFSPLDVFLACSALLDDAPDDQARRLFSEYAEHADAALLLLHPGASREALPLPLAARGLEQASLHDIVAIARSAWAMARPSAVVAGAGETRVVAFSGALGVWVGASGAERIALLRTGPAHEAGQMLGLALRLLRGAPERARGPQEPHGSGGGPKA